MGKVELKPIVKQDGSLDMENNSLSLVLVNIQEEQAMINQQQFFKKSEDKILQIEPAIHLNLLILFAANFTNYDQALKFISLIITFFQSKSHFSGESYPNFNLQGVSEITSKLLPLTLEQQNHLWGTLGAKFMPSVTYKLGILSLEEAGHETEIPRIKSRESEIERTP